MLKGITAIACLASGTYLAAVDKLSAELFVGAIVGPILAGVVAAGAVQFTKGNGGQ